ncbi:FecCD family ABC transporter permease [Salinithrix halophila]|uniref:FecCD family ABC transporter permease n=1 Tax=Salinithrix halophila TaxID=1485204 RepID=A0ABV8JHF8_9BACL
MVIRPKLETYFPLITAGLLLALFASVTAAVMIGPISIPPQTIWKIAFSHIPGVGGWIEPDWSKAREVIIWEIRFPRVLLGVLVGAGLAVVGAAMQALFKNALVDPFIMGVSSGSSVGATLVILMGAFSAFGLYALSVAAFLGALTAIMLVLLLSRVQGRATPIRMLLTGIAVSAIGSALTNLIIALAKDEAGIRGALFWLFGSLTGAKWEHLKILGLVVVIGGLLLIFQYRPLNAMLMGEETAGTLGVNTQRFRIFIVVLSALLTGVIVSVSGVIGFVGLMIPHMVRPVFGSDHRRLLPVSALWGAIFVVWVDVLARLIIAPEELPIGIVTALCGGPFFLWIMRRNLYSFGGDGR